MTGSVRWLPGRSARWTLGLVYFSDHHGRILSEMSLVRLAPDNMMLMAGAGAEWHDQDWLENICS